MKFDFSGYATKNDIKCSDGRIIRRDAFKDCDGLTVPLVWQHLHNEPTNILGHAVLENRDDGVYAYGKFNDTQAGQDAKTLVGHGDIKSLSIYANKLTQKGPSVIHGAIREVSLVLSGANPGALIDNISFAHADGTYDEVEDEAIIYSGLDIVIEDPLQHEEEDMEDNRVVDDIEDEDEETVGEIIQTMSDKQKEAMYAIIADVISETDDVEHSDYDYEDGGEIMRRNVFEKDHDDNGGEVLTHSEIKTIIEDAQRLGSLKDSVIMHAVEYGIEDIDILFPDAKTLTNTPDFIKRDDSWVGKVLGGTRHSPFSRIKSVFADITADEARAKGYVKGKKKTEEVIKLLKRITNPTTIYKKQKLDRDDIIDITDFDVVTWLKAEMRVMLNEEIARAILFGDGRTTDHADKINEESIRPVVADDELYTIKHELSATDYEAILDGSAATTNKSLDSIFGKLMADYEGSGSLDLFINQELYYGALFSRDTQGRRFFNNKTDLAAALGVKSINMIPKGIAAKTKIKGADDQEKDVDVLLVALDLKDYNIGADKGGQVAMFDDFDIDFNQYKYLMETRCSGALIRPKSAITIVKAKVNG